MHDSTVATRHPGIEVLLEILHEEHRVLERLAYRLSEADLLIEARQDRHLASASGDLSSVERQLGEMEMLRAIVVAGIAQTWGVPEHELALCDIIERAPPGLAKLLENERERLRALAAGIEALKHSISETSKEQLEVTQRAVDGLAEYPPDAGGSRQFPS
jgi:hypothetical protein